MTMSGLFERIARRRATPPDETQELDAPALAGPAPSGDEPATEALANGETAPAAPVGEGVREETAPGEQREAVAEHGEATTAKRSDAATAEQSDTPTAEQPTAASEGDAPTEVLPPGEPRASFRERGRVRRRVRYLRRLRELQLRDLGGLVFELRRFGRRREDLVNQKLTQLAATDDELRGLEALLDDRRAIVELREPGIGGACPNCGALHGSADHYCAHCGRPLDLGAANGAATSEPTAEAGAPASEAPTEANAAASDAPTEPNAPASDAPTEPIAEPNAPTSDAPTEPTAEPNAPTSDAPTEPTADTAAPSDATSEPRPG
jgi:hypothetical protein